MTNLKKQAEDLGIDVDGRWSDDTLKEKIEEAKAKKPPAPSPKPAPGEAREIPAIGALRVETAEEVQQTKENAGQPAYPYPGDPKEGHMLAAMQAKRLDLAPAQTPDLPAAGSVAAADDAHELYPIRLLYDWWDGQGVRHPRDEIVDMPLNEAQKLMDEGKGEYAGKLSPSKAR